MLEEAVMKARKIPYVKGNKRVYAIITDKRGRIVAESANSYVQTHPMQKRLGVASGKPLAEFLHAEMAAIIRSKGRGHSLYVARVDSKGKPRMAKPCVICQKAIELHENLRDIYWTETQHD